MAGLLDREPKAKRKDEQRKSGVLGLEYESPNIEDRRFIDQSMRDLLPPRYPVQMLGALINSGLMPHILAQYKMRDPPYQPGPIGPYGEDVAWSVMQTNMRYPADWQRPPITVLRVK